MTFALYCCFFALDTDHNAPERVKSRGGGRGTRRGALQSAARQNAALAQRVSGRMTKGRSKLSVLPEVHLSAVSCCQLAPLHVAYSPEVHCSLTFTALRLLDETALTLL